MRDFWNDAADQRAEPQTAADRRILTVAELNRTVEAALRQAFPDPVWVRGEVQGLRPGFAQRRHVYFELHDTGGSGAADFQIPVSILDWDRRRYNLGCYLDGSDPDFQLRNQLEVCLQCRVDFYPPFGKLSLNVVGIDPAFSLGRLEALRREVLAHLRAERLLDRNGQVPWPELPLHVGLITSAGSAAERDFRTGLEASPFPFRVDLIDCRMQGEQTERQVVQALAVLAGRGVDVIVITRGGGSRADLSWFDQKGMAVAVATCARPVVTAIGHEVDRAIVDVVAQVSCKTPTAAAELLVERVAAQAERLARAAEAVLRVVPLRLQEADRRLGDLTRRGRVARRPAQAARERLRQSAARLEGRVARRVGVARTGLEGQEWNLRVAARSRLAAAGERRRALAARLLREAPRPGRAAGRRLERATAVLQPRRLLIGWPRHRVMIAGLERRLARQLRQVVAGHDRRLALLGERLRLNDPQWLLERGYTVTRDERGRPLRRAKDVAPGMRLETQFPDGRVESVVPADSGTGPRGGKGSRGSARGVRAGERKQAGRSGRKGGGGQHGGEEAEGPQGTLFR
ncbi:MAG: exodeoxyribonuclease VII large subunit [Candidatus Krumholzibacteriia bacterium]